MGFSRATRLATLHNSAILGPSHPDTSALLSYLTPYKPPRVLTPPLRLCTRAMAHTAAKRDELGICAQVSLRYEMPYLLSWLAYHTLLGFDRILLYLDDLKHLGAVDSRKQARKPCLVCVKSRYG